MMRIDNKLMGFVKAKQLLALTTTKSPTVRPRCKGPRYWNIDHVIRLGYQQRVAKFLEEVAGPHSFIRKD